MRLNSVVKIFFASIALTALSLHALPILINAQAIPKVVKHQIISNLKRNFQGDIQVTPKQIFAPTDSFAMSFIELTGPYFIHEAKWEFYNPDGKLHQTTYKGINEKYMSDLIRIVGWPAAGELGTWSVKFYINDELKFTDQFQITDEETPDEFVPIDDVDDVSRFDTNDNSRIDDEEFFSAIDGWIDGTISDQLFFELVDAWISDAPVSSSLVNQEPERFSYKVYDLTGRLIAEGACSLNTHRLAARAMSRENAAHGIYLLYKQNCETRQIERSFVRV